MNSRSPGRLFLLPIRPGFARWDRAYTTSPTTVVLPNNQLGPSRYVEIRMVIDNPLPKLGPVFSF